MKKNHSILWKIIVLLFESIIGGSILAGIILLLFDFIFDFISNTIGSNILGWLGFAIFPLSLLLFTYIGISHISRVSNINSSDVKILPIVLGVMVGTHFFGHPVYTLMDMYLVVNTCCRSANNAGGIFSLV